MFKNWALNARYLIIAVLVLIALAVPTLLLLKKSDDKELQTQNQVQTTEENATSSDVQTDVPMPPQQAADCGAEKNTYLGGGRYFTHKYFLYENECGKWVLFGSAGTYDATTQVIMKKDFVGYPGSATIIRNADPSTFTVIGDTYAKDARYVYYRDSTIVSADPQTFEILSERQGYAKDNSSVFYTTHYRKEGDYILGEADPDTFQNVSESFWWVDKEHVYKYGAVLEGVDRDSFVVLSNVYAKDSAHVYYEYTGLGGGFPEVLESADSASFVILDEDGLMGKDQNAVYFDEDELLEADPATFTFVETGLGVPHAVDKDSVFWYVQTEKGSYYELVDFADPQTFERIHNGYGKDATYVYYNGSVIDGADPETFVVLPPQEYALGGEVYYTTDVLTGYYSKDSDTVFFRNTVILNADAVTFRVLSHEERDGPGPPDAEDKNSTYYYGKRI